MTARSWTEEDFARREAELVAAGVASRAPSVAQRIARSPQRDAILSRLTPIQWLRLRYDWRFWGRPKQLEPLTAVGYDDVLLLGGRFAGKTRTGSETVADRIMRGLARSVCFIGADWEDTRRTMVGGLPDTDSGILDVLPPWYPRDSAEGVIFNQNKKEIYIPRHGCTIYLNTGEKKEQRGGNFDFVWVDEAIKFRYLDTVLMNLDMALRKKNALRLFTSTPKNQDWLRDLMMQPRTLVVHSHSAENADNIDERTLGRLTERYGGTRLGEQELGARILGDNDAAIASSTQIELGRIEDSPDFDETAVGIDPAVSTKRKSDDSGIVACGRKGKSLYVLDDLSGRYSPDGWATAAVKLAKSWGAKFVIVERNKIGDAGVALLMHAIAAAGLKLAIREAYSIKDKWTRAQPVSALYDRGVVHHVGRQPELETEITQWDPRTGGPSPNRLDAFVHAAVELMGLAVTEKPSNFATTARGMLDVNRVFEVDRSRL